MQHGHEVVLIARGMHRCESALLPSSRVSFTISDLQDTAVLEKAFDGCDAVAHCAGINREIGSQSYERIHVHGTRNVVDAARRAGVSKVVLLSFLRARPKCGSLYHESKWAAEEIVRESGLDYTIFKSGMIYGLGDHMLNHLSRAFHTLPLLATVGFRTKSVCPLAIEDLVRPFAAAVVDNRLSRQTTAITGPEELSLAGAAQRVAMVLQKKILIFPAPIMFHKLLATICEWTMKVPLVSRAQVRILSEGMTGPWGEITELPLDLRPTIGFTTEQIRKGLPEPTPFSLHDLRCCLQ
ncbi:MAG TPA: NAD(P)H-binding protein [Terriglobales bacterium]